MHDGGSGVEGTHGREDLDAFLSLAVFIGLAQRNTR